MWVNICKYIPLWERLHIPYQPGLFFFKKCDVLYSLCWCSASSFLPSLCYLSFYARIHSVVSWLVLFSLSGFILVHPLIQQSSSSKAVLISNNFWLEIWFPTSSSLWLICQQVASHNIPYRHRSLEPTGTGLRHSSVIWSAHNTSFRQVMANHRGKKRGWQATRVQLFIDLWNRNITRYHKFSSSYKDMKFDYIF